MKTWIQVCAVIMLAGQMSACGGGNGTGPGADANTSVQTAPSAQLTAPSVEQASSAQVKALTETYNAALNLWANTAPANYHYNFKAGGAGGKFDSYSPVTIWVRDGVISQVTSGIEVLRVEDYQYASMEQLFAGVANALGKGVAVVKGTANGSSVSFTLSEPQGQTQYFMEFDPLLGFPKTATVTSLACCDGAWKMQVTDLTID